MSGVKKSVEVISCDETYYPVVKFLHTKAAEITEAVKVEKSAAVAEAIELLADTDKKEPQEINSTVLADTVKNTTEPKQRRSRLKVWGLRFGTVVVGLVAICAMVLVGLRLAGFRTFTVMSGSMEPEYPVGAMLYVKPVDYHDLKVGDVISYVANDDKVVVTHRIVDIEIDQNDASILRFRTKGDANESADSQLVHYKNVLGTPVIIIPQIGYIAHNIQQPPGVYIALVVGTLLLAWTFLPRTLEERRKTARKSMIAK